MFEAHYSFGHIMITLTVAFMSFKLSNYVKLTKLVYIHYIFY